MHKYIFSLLATAALLFLPTIVRAQTYQPSNRPPVADSTLGTQVSTSGNNFDVTGGLSKGQTLFHSFTDFSVPTGGAANFTNPAGTRDIISRVTGRNFSDLNGLIKSNGANFFLINPNGIVFGNNARLDVGKAFVASTASGLNLVDGSGRAITFGTNPNGDAPLLSVAPNVLFNISSLTMGGGNGQISNFGTLQTANPSQYIGLIGGDISLNGGKIIAPGGRVDLGGLKTNGTVSVNNLGLVFDGIGLTRSDVTIANNSSASVRSTDTLNPVDPVFFGNAISPGSSINISANNIDLINSGTRYVSSSTNLVNKDLGGLDAGLEVNSGAKTGTIGNINLNATGDIKIQKAAIVNLVRSGAQGTGGGIKLDGNNITVTDRSEISTALSENAVGRAGDIELIAKGNVNLLEPNKPALPDLIKPFNFTEYVIGASTYGRGDAGRIKIAALQGKVTVGNGNSIASSIESTGEGNSPGIQINAKELEVIDRGQILSIATASPTGKTGNAGDIEIKTTGNITIAGDRDRSILGISPTINTRAILSKISTNTFRAGNTGKISISTPGKLSILNRAEVQSQIGPSGVSTGAAKGITFDVGELAVANVGRITTTSGDPVIDANNRDVVAFSAGNAGDINIKATGNISIVEDRVIQNSESVLFAYSVVSSSLYSGAGSGGKITIDTPGKVSLGNRNVIRSTVEPDGTGNSKGVEINAGELEIFNQSQLLSFAQSRRNLNLPGSAGPISIKTKGNLTISGNKDAAVAAKYRNNGFVSNIQSGTNRAGKGGDISIDTGDGELILINFGGISSRAQVISNNSAGNITINSKKLNLDGGNVSLTAGDTGGNITISAKEAIVMKNNSNINTNSTRGKGGDIIFTTPELRLNNSKMRAQSSSGNGGNIQIQGADLLLLRRGSLISTNADGTAQTGGNGGNIAIDSKLLVAINNENSDITANAVKGQGGNVTINSEGLFGIQFRPQRTENNDITASSDFGRSGNVNIDTPGADPGKDSTELPNETTDASKRISQVCSDSTREHKFTVTGRGGLPPNANDPLNSDVIWQDNRAANSQPAASSETPIPTKLPPPAVGWKFDGKGKAILIAAGTQGQQTGTNVTCPK